LPVWCNHPVDCFFPGVTRLLAHDASIQKTACLLILHFISVALVVAMRQPFSTVFWVAARQEEKLSVTTK